MLNPPLRFIGELNSTETKNLMPLSLAGLCEAVMTAPKAAPVCRVNKLTMGVGTTPRLSGCRPAEAKPAAKACSKARPVPRVSRPIMTCNPATPDWVCANRAAATPKRQANSSFICGLP